MVVSFQGPEARPRDWLTMPVLPAHAFDATVVPLDHPFRDHAFGTLGMVGDRSERKVLFRAVDDRAERPKIRQFELLAAPREPGRMVRDVLEGRVHGIVSVPPGDWQELSRAEQVRLVSYDTRTFWYVQLDLSHPWLADPRTREALDLLLDRSELITQVIGPLPEDWTPPYEPVSGPMVFSSPRYARSVPVAPHDPGKAAVLLADVARSLPGSPPLLTVGSDPAARDEGRTVAEGIAAQLQAAGLQARASSGEDAQLVVRSLSVGLIDDVSPLLERLPPDPQLQALLEAIRRSETELEEFDAWHALHAHMASARPVLFLWKSDAKSVWRDEVRYTIVGPWTYWGEFGRWRLLSPWHR